MKNNNLKILGVILIFLFTLSIFSIIINEGVIPATNKESSDKDLNIDLKNEEIINENPLELEPPKTANPSTPSRNFSFDTRIVEIANNSFSYENINATEGGFGPGDDLMFQWNYYNTNASFEFYLTGLINATSPEKVILRPNDFGDMAYASLSSFSPFKWDNFSINDDGPGKGNASGYVQLVDGIPFGVSTINYTYTPTLTNITYNATLYFFNAISNKTEKTTFIPTYENTQSDFIDWELQFDNKYFYTWPIYDLPDDYKAIIELDSYFTLDSVLGRKGSYWDPLVYDRNSTHLTIYGSYEEYKISFSSPNFISITYNDILTMQDKKELHLNITCKMDGNLTIEFTDTNGTTFKNEYLNLQKDDIVNYNYIMLNYSKGGLAFLNVTLINSSDEYFGVKYAEITFQKRAQIFGFTDNTTVFYPEFTIGAVFLDIDYADHLQVYEGLTFDSDTIEMFNRTMIFNATVSYELEEYGGELDFIKYPSPGLNLWLYMQEIDLRELQIPPNEYNITFQASKSGYSTSEMVLKPWIVSKRNVTIDLLKTDDILEVEQSFSFTVELKINYTNVQGLLENFLRIPVQVNISFINNDTGEIDGPYPWGQQIVQSFSLYGEIENDSIPGIYYINVTIDSDYYQGSAAFQVEIIKKPLTISVVYDEDDIEEDKEFEVHWGLGGGDSKNRENMSVEVLIDGFPHAYYSLKNSYGGLTEFELGEGEYYVTYRLISPFYTAETTFKIEIEEEEGPKPTWLEKNWLWVLIGIIAVIAMAALALFLLISRQKIKVQRELESELIALKTKTTASEQKLSQIETQITQIASIFWILIVHSEQGTTMVEISDFRLEEALDDKHRHVIGTGVVRDSALIGGFLSAIRDFSRETSGTSLENQPVFNNQTDYSTVINNNEIHRRILEGTGYFMAFVSSRGTIEISDLLASINSVFEEKYVEAVRKFMGAVNVFKPFKQESVTILHNEIRELQKKLSEEQLLLEHYNRHLNKVQEKIGIKPKKSVNLEYK